MIKLTPPMGWNSWNTFGSEIDEKLIMETADVMAESGLLECGYDYLVIDDCWSLRKRDENYKLVPDPEKFPHGMKYVADYVHSKGLKFGMYSCDGYKTCAGFPSSYQYEFIDAETFASWGVDYLKYDNCYKPVTVPGKLLYHKMGLALENCGRDIMFSACNWGVENVQEWIKETGAHLWRSTGDIHDNWESIKDLTHQQIALQPYNGLGCFNDMDMLVVGMNGKGNVGFGGCTYDEYRTHFALWCLLNSPLMIGCDIRIMTPETKAILMNKELIAINQDPAGRQPCMLMGSKDGPKEQTYVWYKHLEGGDLAIGLFNMSDNPSYPWVGFEQLGVDHTSGKDLKIRDVMNQRDLGIYHDMFSTGLEPHCCKVFRCTLVPADGNYNISFING